MWHDPYRNAYDEGWEAYIDCPKTLGGGVDQDRKPINPYKDNPDRQIAESWDRGFRESTFRSGY